MKINLNSQVQRKMKPCLKENVMLPLLVLNYSFLLRSSFSFYLYFLEVF